MGDVQIANSMALGPGQGYHDGTIMHYKGRDNRFSTAGTNGRTAKLDEDKVYDILTRPRYGPDAQANATLAAEFGVSERQIGHIRQRKSWRHVPVPPEYQPTRGRQ